MGKQIEETVALLLKNLLDTIKTAATAGNDSSIIVVINELSLLLADVGKIHGKKEAANIFRNCGGIDVLLNTMTFSITVAVTVAFAANDDHGDRIKVDMLSRASSLLWEMTWQDKNVEITSADDKVYKIIIALIKVVKDTIAVVLDDTKKDDKDHHDANNEILKNLIGALWIFARSNENKKLIGENEGILPLISILANNIELEPTTETRKQFSREVKKNSIVTLGNLAVNDKNREIISDNNGLAIMLNFLKNGTKEEKTKSAGALWNLALGDKNKEAIRDNGGIEYLVILMTKSEDEESRKKAAGCLWNLAVIENNRDYIGECGGVSGLIDLLGFGGEEEKENAVGALRNLALSKKNKEIIRENGGISKLVEYLKASVITLANVLQTNEKLHNKISDDDVGDVGDVGDGDGDDDEITKETKKKILLSRKKSEIKAELRLEKIEIEKAKNAAGALWNLALNDKNKDEIREIGGIIPLIELLKLGNDDVTIEASGALKNMSVNVKNKDEIREKGGILPLIAVLKSKFKFINSNNNDNNDNNEDKDEGEGEGEIKNIRQKLISHIKAKSEAAGAIWNLCASNEINRNAFFDMDGVIPLVDLLKNDVLISINKELNNNTNIKDKDDKMKILEHKDVISANEKLKVQTTGALATISMNDRIAVVVQNADGITPLIELLSSTTKTVTDQLKTQVISALWNLGMNANNKNVIREKGGILELFNFLKLEFLKKIRIKNTSKESNVKNDSSLPSKNSNEEVYNEDAVAFAAGAIWSICEGNETNITYMGENGGIEVLIQVIQESDEETAKRNASSAIWTCVSTNDKNKDIFGKNSNGVIAVIELLTNGSEKGKKVASGTLWSVSNNHHRHNADLIVANNGICQLIKILKETDGSSSPDDGRNNTIWALSNLIHSDNFAESLIACNAVPVLSSANTTQTRSILASINTNKLIQIFTSRREANQNKLLSSVDLNILFHTAAHMNSLVTENSSNSNNNNVTAIWRGTTNNENEYQKTIEYFTIIDFKLNLLAPEITLEEEEEKEGHSNLFNLIEMSDIDNDDIINKKFMEAVSNIKELAEFLECRRKKDGFTILLLACKLGRSSLVAYICEIFTDTNHHNHFLLIPNYISECLLYCVKNNDVDSMKSIFSLKSLMSSLPDLIFDQSVEIIVTISDEKDGEKEPSPPPPVSSSSSLSSSSSSSSSIPIFKCTPLYAAVRFGRYECVKLLLRNGCDSNWKPPPTTVTAASILPMYAVACLQNNIPILSLLFCHGCHWQTSNTISSNNFYIRLCQNALILQGVPQESLPGAIRNPSTHSFDTKNMSHLNLTSSSLDSFLRSEAQKSWKQVKRLDLSHNQIHS